MIDILSYAYNWGYQEIIHIPLNRLRIIMPKAIERYKEKILLQKAILSFIGVKDL